MGAGFTGLGKSAAVLSQQLAQDVNRSSQGTPSELQNRSEEVYSGAVDGLSSSDVNAVVEEIEHEAVVLKKAFQKALHRAMGSVALLGKHSFIHFLTHSLDSRNDSPTYSLTHSHSLTFIVPKRQVCAVLNIW